MEGGGGVARSCFAVFFFGFSASFVIFSGFLLLLRRRPWCNCQLCRAYLTASWSTRFTNLGDWYAHLLRESPTGTIHIHVLGNTVTANPANVEYMLKTRFENFPKGKPFAALLGDLLGKGIFNVDGHAWLHQRKMASLELGSAAVRSYAYKIVASEVNSRLLPLLGSVADRDGTIDLQDVFRRFAFDTICKISFGLDPGCLELDMPISELATAFDTASRMSAKRGAVAAPIIWKTKRLLNIGSERELRNAIKMVDNLAAAVIRERRKIGSANSHDLLSRFMASVDEKKAADDKYLRDIVVSFLLAGRDTVASALTTFFLLLSQNREAVAAMREEMGDVSPSYERLKSLHYVHAALYESMRLYPPVQFDSKFCSEDDLLPDGTFVSGGTRVTYHPYAMGRMETIWGDDCETFKPERWLGEDGVFVPQSLYKYPVFQAGPRACLGKELAIMEMKAVVVSVVQPFDIVLVSENGTTTTAGAPKFAPGLTASLSGGLHVKVRRRESSSRQ